MITPGQNNNMHRNSEILGCHVTQLEKIIHKCYTNIKIELRKIIRKSLLYARFAQN